MRQLTFTLAVLVLFAAAATAQESKPELKINKVAANVYELTGVGGNIGALIGDDGVLLIDTGAAPVLDEIKQALSTVTDKPIRYVVITHFHFDHVGSNAQLGGTVPIISQENVRKRLAEGTTVLGKHRDGLPPVALPTITFQQALDLHFDGEDIHLWHFPNAHTDGDTVVFFPKANVVHMGDELFAGTYPFVDVENGGNVIGLYEAVDKVLGMVPQDAKFIAGHGPVYSYSQMKDYSAMLKDCVSLVEAAMKQGKTLDQMKSEGILSKYDKMSGFIKTPQFTEAVYNSIKAREKAE